MDNTDVSIASAKAILQSFQMDDERSNERSAMTLIALASLRLGDQWGQATNNMLRTRAIMDWIRDECGMDYAPNTRETIRRFTLHQFDEAGLVEQNADEPERPINSPKWNYRLTDRALKVIQAFGTPCFKEEIDSFFSGQKSWMEIQKERREIHKVPVRMPDGLEVKLSAGGQNVLIKGMIEEFCPRFAPGAEVLYIGDTDHKEDVVNKRKLKSLGIVLPKRGKAPDLIVWREDTKWLYLMEACSTHGPVDVTRKKELERMLQRCQSEVVFVSCFPSRKIMQKYLGDLAWETEAWCADSPDHMIHLNGSKLLGPYKKHN